MDFKEAHKRLNEIANGTYHTLKYQITTYHDGTMHQECGVYIDGSDWYNGPSWENAFSQLETSTQNGTVEKTPSIPELV